MSQHDYEITQADADTGVTVRAAINAALQSLASCSSGAVEPSTMYAYQLWADTTSGKLKIRNGANTGWITLLDMATSITASNAELNYLLGLTSAVQGQLNSKLVAETGSITAVITGYTGAQAFPNYTIAVPYTRIGDIVTLELPQIQGTMLSTAVALNFTGSNGSTVFPNSLKPTATRYKFGVRMVQDGTVSDGGIHVTTTGTISLLALSSSPSQFGSPGILAGTYINQSVSYRL